MLIKEPKVYLTSQTQFNYDTFIEFLDDEGIDVTGALIGHNDIDCTVETACRLCYMSYGKGRKSISNFLNHILAAKHGSVLEHVAFGFIFTGVSRTLTHELVRHRAGFAFSQLSQRYYDSSKANFVVPPIYIDYNINTEGLQADLEDALEAYNFHIEQLEKLTPELPKSTKSRKAIKEAARSILPNSTETKIYVTANVRAWRHFLELRGSIYADPEIRRLSLKILPELQKVAPILFGDFTTEVVDDTEIIVVENSKV